MSPGSIIRIEPHINLRICRRSNKCIHKEVYTPAEPIILVGHTKIVMQ